MVEISSNSVEYAETLNILNLHKSYDKEGEYFSFYTALQGVPGSAFTMTVRNKENLVEFFQSCLELLNDETNEIYSDF